MSQADLHSRNVTNIATSSALDESTGEGKVSLGVFRHMVPHYSRMLIMTTVTSDSIYARPGETYIRTSRVLLDVR